MKKELLAAITLAAVGLTASNGRAQPWHYDFGTSTGSFATPSGSDSTVFLSPAEPDGGKPRVRIGTTGGSFNLEDQLIAFGSGSYFRGVAPTSTSVNKFSIYNYSAGQSFTLRFRLRLGASDGSASASSGTWSLFVGDGPNYSDNSSFSGSQVFTGIRWQFGPAGAIAMQYRNAGAWSTAGLAGVPIVQGQNSLVEIYGNNGIVTLLYTLEGGQAVAPQSFDIWIDGVLVGDDLPKGLLAAASPIDSWMFYGESSTGNAANIFLDDFTYTNGIAETRLPVRLASLFACAVDANTVTLSWRTLSEVANYGFEVEKSTDGDFFSIVHGSFIPGHGTTNTPFDYSFTDHQAEPGVHFYRLRQLDLDGTIHLSDPVRVEILAGTPEAASGRFMLSQNYPNPFNPSTTIQFSILDPQFTILTVNDLLGREVAVLVNGNTSPGTHAVSFNASGLAGGVYFYRLTTTSVSRGVARSEVKQMVLTK
jgi:hypothetical protein